MNGRHAQPTERRLGLLISALGGLVVLISTARCGGASSGPSVSISSAAIRIGVGGVPQLTAQAGLQQVISSLSFEGLVRFHDDGRPSPWLAESWTTAEDNLSITLQLRKQATFHDGTP